MVKNLPANAGDEGLIPGEEDPVEGRVELGAGEECGGQILPPGPPVGTQASLGTLAGASGPQGFPSSSPGPKPTQATMVHCPSRCPQLLVSSHREPVV